MECSGKEVKISSTYFNIIDGFDENFETQESNKSSIIISAMIGAKGEPICNPSFRWHILLLYSVLPHSL